MLQSLIDIGNIDCLQEKQLKLTWHINSIKDSIEAYKEKLALTSKAIYEKLLSGKQAEFEELNKELSNLTDHL